MSTKILKRGNFYKMGKYSAIFTPSPRVHKLPESNYLNESVNIQIKAWDMSDAIKRFDTLGNEWKGKFRNIQVVLPPKKK